MADDIAKWMLSVFKQEVEMKSLPELALPDLTQAKRILAIQPHYDDNDIAAGGTLLTLARAGVELIYLTVTDDIKGVLDTSGSLSEKNRALHADRRNAGALTGVSLQHQLGFPDAGDYNYFDVRGGIMREIWTIKPDFIFTVDPWLPYEAHHDHLLTGKAAAEAAVLYDAPGFSGGGAGNLTGYELKGVVFYNTAYPNLIYDISPVLEQKNELLRCYQAQFTPEGLEDLVSQTSILAAYMARDEPFAYGEGLKVVAPWMLHGVPVTKDL